MKKFSMKYKKNLISIITVVFNGEKYLEKAIKSILNQTYNKFELIIIDGGSTDGTLNIIKKYKRSIKYWVSEKDDGIYDAMNKGIKKANGDIIGILNSDDTYRKNALKIVNNYFTKNKKIKFLFGSVKKDRILNGFYPNDISWKFNIYPAHSSGFFIKKIVHKRIGLYNSKFKFSADYDLFYRLIVKHKLYGVCTKFTEVTGNFRLDGLSSRVSIYNKMLEEFKIRIHNNQNKILVISLCLIKFFYYWLCKIKTKF